MGQEMLLGSVTQTLIDQGRIRAQDPLGQDLDPYRLDLAAEAREGGIEDLCAENRRHRQVEDGRGGAQVIQAFLATAIGVEAEVGVGIEGEETEAGPQNGLRSS